jgi:hypothetical protein
VITDLDFDYEIKHTRRKGSIGIQIRDGRVKILAPHQTPKQHLYQLMHDKQGWIKNQLALYRRHHEQAPGNCLIEGKSVSYLGANYRLHFTQGPLIGISVEAEQLNITLPPETSPEASQLLIGNRLKLWYQQQAQVYFPRRLACWNHRMGLHHTDLKIRPYKSRWGSCNNRGKLTLNTLLIMAPPAVIDYVIIHELCHLTHLNHSRDFWQLVARYCPDYPRHRLWLKRHAPDVNFE